MKKTMALFLALLLILTCASAAFAQTVCVKPTVDREQAANLAAGFGVPEAQVPMIDAVLALVNALGVRVTTVEDGAQMDLDLNGEDALSLGWITDDAGVGIASTLFPNYCLTVSNETIAGIMEQMASNMPGAGGEGDAGGFDMAAMQQVLGGYFQKWMETCASAGVPGKPVAVEFEYEGHAFDTLVPVTVDMAVITAATNELLDELLADPAAMSMMQGMAQGMAQSGGMAFDPETFEADFKAGFEEWMAHFPDAVNAEVYTNAGDESNAFFMNAESFREGDEAPFFTAFMLYEDTQNMDMGFAMEMADEQNPDAPAMEAGFSMKDADMKLYLDLGGMYMGLDIHINGGDMAFDVFFMNEDKPLLTVALEITDDGDRTLPMDDAGKTVIPLEDIMANANGDAAQGLFGDIQANGLGALMGVAIQQVPELGQLMGGMVMAG